MKRFLLSTLACIILLLTAWLLFSFPFQRYYAEQTFEAYTQLQEIDPHSILSLTYQKDYTQNSYYIEVRYKEEPELRYQYQYFFKKSWGHHAMMLTVFDDENAEIPDYSALLYPPLPWNFALTPNK